MATDGNAPAPGLSTVEVRRAKRLIRVAVPGQSGGTGGTLRIGDAIMTAAPSTSAAPINCTPFSTSPKTR